MLEKYNKDGTLVNLIEDKELVCSTDEVFTGKMFGNKKIYRKYLVEYVNTKGDFTKYIYIMALKEILKLDVTLLWIDVGGNVVGGVCCPTYETLYHTHWWLNGNDGISINVTGYYSIANWTQVKICVYCEYTK